MYFPKQFKTFRPAHAALAAFTALLAGAGGAQATPPPTAAEARLEADLARLPAGARYTLIVPRLGAVLDPLLGALNRLQAHPALAETLAPVLLAVRAQAGFDVFSPAAHAELGLDLDGALWAVRYGEFPQSQAALAVPFTAATQATDYLRLALGAAPQPTGPGRWRVGDSGHLWHADGRALVSEHAALLDRLQPALGAATVTGSAAALIEGCPRAAGEADLFLRFAGPLDVQGCATLRLDADRVRLDLRVTSFFASGWLGSPDPALLAHGGPVPAGDGLVDDALATQAAAVAAVRLGPKAVAMLRGAAPAPVRGLAEALDGRFVAVAGPDPEAILVRFGLAPDAPKNLVARLAPMLAAHARVLESPEGLLIFPTTPPAAPRAQPGQPAEPPAADAPMGTLRQDARWLVLTGARQARAPGAPAAWTADRVDRGLFQAPALLVSLRPGGPPGDGGPLLEALLPLAKELGVEPEAIRKFASGMAFLAGHFGEVALRLVPTARGIELSIEAVIL